MEKGVIIFDNMLDIMRSEIDNIIMQKIKETKMNNNFDMIKSFYIDELNFLVLLDIKLSQTNSQLEKIEILKASSILNPTMFKSALNYVYDFNRIYGVTSKTCIKKSDLVEQNNETFTSLLDKLNDRVYTGHKAISMVNGFVENLDEQHKNVFWRALDKNLKNGASETLINKVMPDCIPTFECALANKYKDRANKVDFNTQSWFISRKLDGCLHKDSLLETDQGVFTIKDVVENNKGNLVKSYNIDEEKIEYKSILNRFKNGDDINENTYEWYEIETVGGKKLKLTGNHRVYLPELGIYRRVDELDENDIVLIN